MNLVLTKRAQRKFISIKEYIRKNFGEKTAEDFEQNTADFLSILINSPLIGAVQIQDKGIRAIQLTKQTTVFYRIKVQNIIILTFFDVRQNPDKKPK